MEQLLEQFLQVLAVGLLAKASHSNFIFDLANQRHSFTYDSSINKVILFIAAMQRNKDIFFKSNDKRQQFPNSTLKATISTPIGLVK